MNIAKFRIISLIAYEFCLCCFTKAVRMLYIFKCCVLKSAWKEKNKTGGNMGSPDGSSSDSISKPLNENEKEEPDPHRTIHAAAALSISLR